MMISDNTNLDIEVDLTLILAEHGIGGQVSNFLPMVLKSFGTNSGKHESKISSLHL